MTGIRTTLRTIGLAAIVGLLFAPPATAGWFGHGDADDEPRPDKPHVSGQNPGPLANLVAAPGRVIRSITKAVTPKKKAEKPKLGGVRRTSKPHGEPTKAADPFWSGWFKPKDPPKIKDMRDWMALEPVRP